MTSDITGKKILFLLDNSGVEEAELVTPRDGLSGAGAQITLAAPEKDTIQSFEADVNKAGTYQADAAISDVSADDFDGLLLPGGTTNADALRLDADAVALVKAFASAGKPVAAICHGPWTLVEAGVLPGKTLTSFPSLQTDIRNAGGTWVDEQAHTCPSEGWTLVTSRNPDDLDAFVDAAAEAYAAS